MPSKKSLAISAAGVVVLATVLQAYVFAPNRHAQKTPTPEVASAMGLRFKLDEIQSHDFDYSISMALDKPLLPASTGASPPVPAELSISGVLFSKVIAVNPQNALVAFQLTNSRCELGHGKLTDCRDLYGTLFLARVNSRGDLIDPLFSPNFPDSHKRKLLSLFEPLKLGIEVPHSTVWNSVEEDSLGSAVVRSAIEGDGQQRTKLDYISLKSDSGIASRAQIDASRVRLLPSKKFSWFDSALISEKVSLFHGNRRQIQFGVSLNLSRRAALGVLPNWTDLGEEDLRKQIASKVSPPGRSDELRALRDFDEITRSIQQEVSPGERMKFSQELEHRLIKNPSESARIKELILNPNTGETARGQLIYGLQSADTAESRAVLRELLLDRNVPEGDKRRALIAMGFTTLDTESIALLWDLAAEGSTQDDQTRASMAILALGNGTEKLAKSDSDLAASIISRLQSGLSRAATLNQTEAIENFLLALGNSGDKGSQTLLQSQLDSDSDRVRAVAAEAIQASKNNELIEPLAARLLQEESASVRSALVDSIASFPPSEATFATALQAFVEEQDNGVRLKLAQYVSRATLSFPEGKRAISELVEIESNPVIHKILLQGATGTRRGE